MEEKLEEIKMHRKRLMQACLTGALVVSMGVSNAPVAMAASVLTC